MVKYSFESQGYKKYKRYLQIPHQVRLINAIIGLPWCSSRGKAVYSCNREQTTASAKSSESCDWWMSKCFCMEIYNAWCTQVATLWLPDHQPYFYLYLTQSIAKIIGN